MVFSLVSCAKNEGVNQPIDPPVSEDMIVTDVPETSATTETTTAETTTEATTTESTTTEVTTTEATATTPETTTVVTTTTEATTTREIVAVSREMYIKREASVREAPDEDAKRVAKLEKGDKVLVSEIVDGTWYLVACGDITGYVKSGYLSDDFVSATQATTTAATTTAATTVTTTAASVKEETRYSPDDKLIALSFDDGPSLGSTNALLDYFEEMGIVGTFFVIGNNINDETAEVMKRAYEMGCEIGNHSKSHQQMGNMIPPTLEEEINYVQDLVEQYVGVEPVLFRPPFLNVSQTMHDTIDLTFIFGHDSLDWTGISAEERAQNVLNFAADGVIVLMHDGWDNYETVEAVKLIVPELLAEGYKFVTISELFEAKGVTIDHNKMYSEVK